MAGADIGFVVPAAGALLASGFGDAQRHPLVCDLSQGAFRRLTAHLQLADQQPIGEVVHLLVGAGLQLRQSALQGISCLLYTSPSPRDLSTSRMPSSA